jgi:hypothetical protein
MKEQLSIKGYAQELFNKVDHQKRGAIDAEEIREAMQIIGFDFSPKICSGFMTKFDFDKSGQIDVEEFTIMIENRLEEIKVRIRNLSGQLIMTSRPDEAKPDLEALYPRKPIYKPIVDLSGQRDANGRRISCGHLDIFTGLEP